MPAINATNSPTILVTGANGYIALWVIQLLLDRGYSVRGQVRAASKIDGLKAIFDKEKYKGRLEWVVVPNIVPDDAFDEAVKGVVGIVHTASPLPELGAHADQNKPFFQPVVNGTLSVLKSAAKYGQVKRIVITSTVGAVISPVTQTGDDHKTVIFTENDWNDAAIEAEKQFGEATPAMVKYCAAKVLAERAVKDYVEKHKSEIGYEVSTILPTYIFGPGLAPVKNPEQLVVSLWQWRDVLFGDQPEEVLAAANFAVDVRDVALAHVLALETEAAGGETIITSNSEIDTYQGIRNQIREIDPTVIIPIGNPDAKKVILMDVDNTKSRKLLGLQYTDGKKSIQDTLTYFKEQGLIQSSLQ